MTTSIYHDTETKTDITSCADPECYNKSITYYVISINDEKLDLQLNRFKQNVASCFHVRTEVINDKNDDQSLLVLYPALQAHTPADGGHPAHDKFVLFFLRI